MKPSDCEHDFSIMLALPLKLMGAILGWRDYRECSACGKLAPANSLKGCEA